MEIVDLAVADGSRDFVEILRRRLVLSTVAPYIRLRVECRYINGKVCVQLAEACLPSE